jgi:hypothetical protein
VQALPLERVSRLPLDCGNGFIFALWRFYRDQVRDESDEGEGEDNNDDGYRLDAKHPGLFFPSLSEITRKFQIAGINANDTFVLEVLMGGLSLALLKRRKLLGFL